METLGDREAERWAQRILSALGDEIPGLAMTELTACLLTLASNGGVASDEEAAVSCLPEGPVGLVGREPWLAHRPLDPPAPSVAEGSTRAVEDFAVELLERWREGDFHSLRTPA